MNVVIDAGNWHSLCHELKLGEPRKERFQEYFDCTVKWRSRVYEWTDEFKPGPVMVLTFNNEKDATVFALLWL